MVGTLRKLVWAFEFWNVMLVPNIRCKNLLKSLSFKTFLLEFWEERGEKLMTCHLFLDNFFEISWPLGCFQRLRVLKQNLVSRKLKYLNFDIMKCSSFLNFVFCERRFIAENWLCFRACNSRIVTYDKEFCLVVWFLCFNHCYRIFWKSFLFKKSWCCRKHVFIFEIVSLKGLNKSMIKSSFSLDCWVERFVHHCGKCFENFSILGVDFWVKPFEKVLMCSLFLGTS